MVIIISADEIKKTLPNYDPEKSEQFHTESARMADRDFDKAIKSSPYKSVVLLSGGTASGKTEFLVTQLTRKRCVVLDATLTTEKGAGIKIKKIKNLGKCPIIYSIIPDDLNRAFIAFLNRDRKFSDEHFYRTHSGARSTLLWIAQEHSDVEINIIESSYTEDQTLQFAKIEFDSKKQMIEYLTSKQVSETDIITEIQSKL